MLTEVHLYIPNENLIKPGNYTIPLENVRKIEVLGKNKGRTTANHIISTIGVTVAIVLAVAAISLSSSSFF